LSADSVMPVPVPSISEIPGLGRLDGVDVGEERRAWLRDVALAGPAAVLGRALHDARRDGLFERLVAPGQLEQALADAGHIDGRKRSLPGAATVNAVLGLALHSGEGYDSVLAKMAPHLRGGTLLPGQVPSASALSQSRVRLGEQPLYRLFLAQAADRPPAHGPGAYALGLHVTGFDGTCLELAGDEALIEAFGLPTGAKHPMARVVTLVACTTRRILAAAIGSYLTSEQELVDQLAEHLRAGTVNLADRNFFSMDRWLRFAATGAHLLWRVKNGATSLPARILERLPDGSYLVRLRESDGMRGKRRAQNADPGAERLPETTARLVEFDVTVADERGRTRTSRIRLLTTLLDHERYPAKDLAGLYAERWQVEIAYLRLKKELRGPGTVLRARRPQLVRQEIWAFLIVYNLLCDLAADAAALDGIDPDQISFVTVIRLTRTHLSTDQPCTHCGHRPEHPRQALTSAIADIPRNRTGRGRTSPRTSTERNNGHTQKAHYTITIAEANLLKAD